MTAVAKGRCAVVTEEERKEGIIEGGLLTVDPEQVTVLTSGIAWNE